LTLRLDAWLSAARSSLETAIDLHRRCEQTPLLHPRWKARVRMAWFFELE